MYAIRSYYEIQRGEAAVLAEGHLGGHAAGRRLVEVVALGVGGEAHVPQGDGLGEVGGVDGLGLTVDETGAVFALGDGSVRFESGESYNFV